MFPSLVSAAAEINSSLESQIKRKQSVFEEVEEHFFPDLFWPLGLSFHVGGIDRRLSEGLLPLLLSHVIQFRGPVEFIVAVYGPGWAKCNLAVWTDSWRVGEEGKGPVWGLESCLDHF